MASLIVLIRAIHMGSCLVLTSLFMLILLVVVPACRQADEDTWQALVPFYRKLRRLLVACLLAGFLSGLMWLWFVTADMTGSTLYGSLNSNLLLVLRQTEFGHLWELRSGIALLLAVMLRPLLKSLGDARKPSVAFYVCAFLSAALLATLAWAGHGGATDGPGHYVHVVADAVHLVAAGVWPSSLLPFALFLACILKSDRAPLRSMACVATRRFSMVSLVTVGLLALSGIINSYFLVGDMQGLFSTAYGRLLLLKLVFFAAMVCIGAWNLLCLKPQLPTVSAVADEVRTSTLRAITRNVIIELCLGTFVLLVVGLLGITPPAMHCPMP